MKKLICALCLLGIHSLSHEQTVVTADLIPQYAVSSATAGSQIMTVCRMKLSMGVPNAGKTYRYISGVSTSAIVNAPSVTGGGFFVINPSIAVSVPSLGIMGYAANANKSLGGASMAAGEWNAGSRYGSFTTDAGGNYTGWFCVVLDGSIALGSQVYFYVHINDGIGGTAVVQNFRSAQTMTVRDFSSGTNGGCSITGTSPSVNKQMVALYDNVAGTGTPLFITWTEDDGISEQWTTWYNNYVGASTPGKWAGWIPNQSSNGLGSVTFFDAFGAPQYRLVDMNNDGQYNSNSIQTKNANNGTTPMQLNGLTQIERMEIIQPMDLQRSISLNLFSPDGQLALYNNLNVGSNSIGINTNPILDPNNGGYKIVCDNTSTLNCIGTNAYNIPSYINSLKNLSVSNPSGVKMMSDLVIENQLDLSSIGFGVGRMDLNNFKLTLKGPAILPANATGLFVSTTPLSATLSSLVFDGNSTGVYIPSGLSDIKNLTLNNPNGLGLKADLNVRGDITFTNNALIDAGTKNINLEGNIFGQGGQTPTSTGQVLIFNSTNSMRNIQGSFAVLQCNVPVVMNGDLSVSSSISINSPFSIANNKLTIKGSWGGNAANVTGTTASSIEFAGSIAQTIPNTANINNIGSLICNNPVSVTLGTNMSIANSLELLQGEFKDGGNTITLTGDIKGSGKHSGTGKIVMLSNGSGGAFPTPTYISDATLNNVDLNSANNFELNGTNTGETKITGVLNLISGTLKVKDKGLYFIGSTAAPITRTSGTITLVKQSSLGFGTKTIKNTGTPLTLPAGIFVANSTSPTRTNGTAVEIGNFVVNRTNYLRLNAQQFDLYKTFSLVDGTLILPNSYQFDLKSNSIAETAMVDMTDLAANPGAKITYGTDAAFSIERFIPKEVDAGAGRKTWRDIAPGVIIPLGTMFTDLQEAAPASPIAGIGIAITGMVGSGNDPVTGLDKTPTGSPSAKTDWVDPATGIPTWVNILNTKTIEYNGLLPYRVYVRGDRNNNYNPSILTLNNSTKVRAKGKLIIGDVTINKEGASCADFSTSTQRINSGDDGTGSYPWTMIANPYAAPLSWAKILAHNPDISKSYTIYDPNAGTIGAYVSWMDNGSGDGGGTKSNNASDINGVIQPGQSFFIANNGTTNVTFTLKESDKIIDATKLSNVYKTASKASINKEAGIVQKIDIGLIQTVTGQDNFRDGTVVLFSNQYSNNIDGNDIRKMDGTTNDIAIKRAGKKLAIETRMALQKEDTIPVQLTGLASGNNYKLGINLAEFNGTELTQLSLKDALLNIETPLQKGITNYYNFQPSSSTTSYANRFSIIMKTATVLAANTFNLTGSEKNKGVQLAWMVTEKNVVRYEIEHSTDGTKFYVVGNVVSIGEGNHNYDWFNNSLLAKMNYYRIKAVNNNGGSDLSNVVKVSAGNSEPGLLKLYPNPAKNIINVEFSKVSNDQTINVRLINSTGQLISFHEYEVKTGQHAVQLMVPPSVPAGIYTIELKNELGIYKQSIIVQQ